VSSICFGPQLEGVTTGRPDAATDTLSVTTYLNIKKWSAVGRSPTVTRPANGRGGAVNFWPDGSTAAKTRTLAGQTGQRDRWRAVSGGLWRESSNSPTIR